MRGGFAALDFALPATDNAHSDQVQMFDDACVRDRVRALLYSSQPAAAIS